ncbi:HAMP domain-containing sensor histidine kinase [Fodinicola feengrottensis]|uniref:histidine kinase n=1 Tax=Fodinicola feengrottensis TaxID=435914 RepID=A0ABP4RNF0_9ACTN
MTEPRSDLSVLRRARWLLTAQLAGAVTIVVLMVGGLSVGMMLAEQHRDAERNLQAYALRGDVEHPPPCVWMFATEGTQLRRTPGAPIALPVADVMAEVAQTGVTQVQERRVAGLDYLIGTQRLGSSVVQVVIDLRYQMQERQRLYAALSVAELAGLVAAVVAGTVLARRAMAPLEDALCRQTRFVADASHELRTPLTRLRVRAQLLARETADAEVLKLVADTEDMAAVIDDLLLSAQLRGTGARTAPPVGLAAVASAVVAAESARAEATGVELSLHLRDPADRYVVSGIEPALRRVVSALVDNALGHTFAGDRIAVELGRRDRAVLLSVRDTGVGLEPADVSRIFERFARGQSSPPGGGRRFGLGLALVREVVQGHGGSVTAAGAPGAGATFTVVLPSALKAATPPAAEVGGKVPLAGAV